MFTVHKRTRGKKTSKIYKNVAHFRVNNNCMCIRIATGFRLASSSVYVSFTVYYVKRFAYTAECVGVQRNLRRVAIIINSVFIVSLRKFILIEILVVLLEFTVRKFRQESSCERALFKFLLCQYYHSEKYFLFSYIT